MQQNTMSIDNKDIYNKKWTAWEDMKKFGPMARWIRKLMMKSLEGISYASVLDVGCGEGYNLSSMFNHSHVKLIGADFSQTGIDLAKKKNPGISFHLLDIEKESLEETFDLVMCSEVLEHVKDVNSSLKNLSEMTGKYLLVTTVGGRMRDFETYVGHLRNFNYIDLNQKIESHGFTIIKKYNWGFPFYSPLYRNLLNRFHNSFRSVSEGKYGLKKKIISHITFLLFHLNRYQKGDKIVILAKKNDT